MRWIICVLLTVFASQPVSAADWHELLRPDWSITNRPYVGLGGSYVHHTGHDPDTPLKAEQWQAGGKAFAGIEISRHLNAEVAYHYLNETPLFPTFQPWKERSYAVAGSLMMLTVPVTWPFVSFPYRGFVRAGVAYKHITDTNPFISPFSPVQVESGVAYVLGAGFEIEFTKYLFGRMEYEYISKVGTVRAINVQHTPLSGSLGVKF